MLSIWAVKTGVVAALKTALIPDTADIVALGRPVEVPPLSQPRRLYIGDVVNDTPQPIYEPSSTRREEAYVIPLLVDCIAFTGNDPDGYQTAFTNVAAMVQAIVNQIDTDQSWGGVAHNSGLALIAEATSPLVDGPGGSGWRSTAILELHVQRHFPLRP